MSDPEPTNEGRTRRVINEEVQMPKTGIITKVYEHTQTDDVWNFHVDVRINPEQHPRRVPVAVAAPDLIAPPRSSSHSDGPDFALVQFMEDNGTSRPVVTNILYNNEDRPPLGKEGFFRLRRGDTYVEINDDGSWARISKKSADDGTPSAEISLEESGGNVHAIVDADSVILGAGGTQIIKDVSVNTTKDGDGHVTDVTLNITRSTVSETE